MKKVSKMQWENYKNSSRGQKVIAEFARLYNENIPVEEILALCQKYDPQFFVNHGPSNLAAIKRLLMFYNNLTVDVLEKVENENEINNAVFYEQIIDCLMGDDADSKPQSEYKMLLAENMFLSVMLYSYLPTLFLPNLWVMQYKYFKDIAKNLEMELPEEPQRFNYIDRCFYYLTVNLNCLLFTVLFCKAYGCKQG